MGYRIDYQSVRKGTTVKKRNIPVFALSTGLILLALLMHFCWPDGRRTLLSFLIPGDTAVTVSALETMAGELRAGQSLAEAFREFCLRVMAG